MGSLTNAISFSMANFVGSVVGFLNVLKYTSPEPPPCHSLGWIVLTSKSQFTAFLRFEFHYRLVIL